MIKAEQIPDEVVEEAAIAAMKDGGCGLTVEGKHVLCCDSRVRGLIGAYGESLWCDVADCSCYTMARAALAAGLAAWPGAELDPYPQGTGKKDVVKWYLDLPLIQDNNDD